MNNVNALNELGQSIWLNYLRRAFVESGELNEYLAAGIAGVTSTPLIFEKAIIGSADYDRALAQSVKAGLPVKTIYEALVVDDCQRACDLLHPLFERSQGVDGYVSVELDPDLAHDEIGTVATARHLMTTVNRANAMLEIPATPAGLSALITLIGEGISVNVTHVFSLATYEAAARAYLAGIKNYLDVHSGWPFRPASVVSFSVSSVDSAVDTVLAAIGRPDLQGQTAIALAKVIYSRFRDLFSGPEWEAMLHRRAHPQRPKWTRTTPRNFAYPATFYVEALIGPNTVTTVAPAVFHAFGERDLVNSTLTTGLEEAHAHLATLAELGIDLEAIANQLQAESLANFHTYYQALMGSAARKRDQLDAGWQRMEVDLGPLQAEVNRALAGVAERRLMTRIWAYDPTVWRSGPETPRDRLNWLPAVEVMQEHAGRIQVFASSVLADRYTRAVCLEKGEASLVPQLFYQTFGKPARPSHSRYPYLELAVLDVNDPQAVLTESRRPDLDQTLFIVPGRVEEDSTGLYGFLDRMEEVLGANRLGEHFITIADPDSPMVEIARRRHFRETFLDQPRLRGAYAVFSFWGLVPAALFGVNPITLLDRAQTMVINAASCNQADNLAARLGATLATMAQTGRDRLTLFTSPAVASFNGWLRQLVVEEAKLPLSLSAGEAPAAPDRYGLDRLFVYLRLRGDDQYDVTVRVLQDAGRPVVTLHLEDLYDLAGQFFLWKMALTVAAAQA